MRADLKNKGKEMVDRNVARLIERFPHSKEYIMRIDMEEETRITKWFPLFLVICIALWLSIMLYRGDFSMSSILQFLCLSFVICFAVLGALLFRRMGPGPLSKWALVIMAAGLSALIVLLGELTLHLRIVDIVDDMLAYLGIGSGPVLSMLMIFLFLSLVMLFTPVGVLSVVNAYLRRYMGRLFLDIQGRAGTGTRTLSEGFFEIPDIIDVKEVRMEPELDYSNVNIGVFMHLWSYTTVMGALIASYLFLSPYFLDTMTSHEMLAVILMLSMFVPAMIIPWQIVRDLKVQVISDAPRPYYLWNGAKRRLFGSFLALGAFSMMFFLALYYGYSIGALMINYVYLIFPLSCIALMYSLTYANNFNNVLKAVIYARFMDGMNKEQ